MTETENLYALQEYGIKIEIHEDKEPIQLVDKYYEFLWIKDEKSDKKTLNEGIFADYFIELNQLKYSHGMFYNSQGTISEELVSHEISGSLRNIGVSTQLASMSAKLLQLIKEQSTVPTMEADENIIPFANGNFHIDTKTFHIGEELKSPFRFKTRLEYKNLGDTPYFSKWLNDLFTPDDQRTILEYLGYCLTSSTKTQKALFVVGEAKRGKSIIKNILGEILGKALLPCSVQDLEEDKYILAELENKTTLCDDDLDGKALLKTGIFKKIITNNGGMTAQRKFGQPFEFTPKVKIVACCNELLTSLYDKSDGFYRRLLPVLLKPKDLDFEDDPSFWEKIKPEIEAITQKVFVLGLLRLIDRNWRLSISERSQNYLKSKQSVEDHLPTFFEDCFDLSDKNGDVSTAEIKSLYNVWCVKNSITPNKDRAIEKWFSDNAPNKNITTSRCVRRGSCYIRGYVGLKINPEWEKQKGTIQL